MLRSIRGSTLPLITMEASTSIMIQLSREEEFLYSPKSHLLLTINLQRAFNRFRINFFTHHCLSTSSFLSNKRQIKNILTQQLTMASMIICWLQKKDQNRKNRHIGNFLWSVRKKAMKENNHKHLLKLKMHKWLINNLKE